MISKQYVHVRSKTSGNSCKRKLQNLNGHDESIYNCAVAHDSKIISPHNNSLTFSNSTVSNKMRQNSKKKSRKSAKSLYQNNTVTYNNQNSPKLQTSISNENTIVFHRTQNKSPCDGAVIS